MIHCKSPLRISFMGGRTDFPSFYQEEDGFVVSTTIDKHVSLTVEDSQGVQLEQEATEQVELVSDLKNSLVRHVLRSYGIEKNIGIHIKSDTPTGTGLGSSSSLTVALIKALQVKTKGNVLSNTELAEKACHIEINELGCNTGKQDQYAAAFGGLNAFTFLATGEVKVDSLQSQHAQSLEMATQLYYTGISRDGTKILEAERKTTEVAKDSLRRMADLAREFYKELKEGGDLLNLGRILDEGWKLKKGVNQLISNSMIEESYQIALSAGAYGGKLLGAGGGGYLLFICPPEKQQNLQTALAHLQPLGIKFSTDGAKVI